LPLKGLNLKPTYASEDDSLLEDFYIPALSCSEVYDRAVGYFSASMLSYAAQGLSQFVGQNGVMRLLIGEPLSTEEYEAVRKGIDLRAVEERIGEKMAAILQHADSALVQNRLDILSWLVAANRLEIRFALTDRGMFHEKMGVMTDSGGDSVVFQGSANETTAALLPDFNFESIAVYPSWKPEIFESYALPYINRFELIWKGHATRVTTIDVPSRSYDLLKAHYKKSYPPQVEEPKLIDYLIPAATHGFPRLPSHIGASSYEPHLHQRQALQEWKANAYSGIMALATGSGKTITALHGATMLASYHREHEHNFVLVVSVPYQVLADQWCDVMKLFDIAPHRCYRGKQYWQSGLDQAVSSLNLHEEPKFVAIVVVNATLRSQEFQSIIGRVDANDLMFIGDECHHHKSASVIVKLPPARYRLGLSATPWRASDEEGREALKGYYSGVVSIYSIADALRDDVLVPYEYEVYLVELTEDESEEYQALSDKLAPLFAQQEQGKLVDSDYMWSLRRARIRILGSASNKFALLSKELASSQKQTHCLFYCGDGSTEYDTDDRSLRDVERMAQTLNENGWKSSRVTAEETAAERTRILENFRYSYIDAVVAIRVLDEGFDMPECETAYLLASSRNERQFIQRRGRILRTAAGKEKAKIYDFLMRPNDNFRSSAMTSMVRQELVRAVEFARFSQNESDTMEVVEELCAAYDVDIEEVHEEVEGMEIVVG
tara:strand:+ start:103 stop:2265 length:2163 start_codon:yes stop_codon:yes gene_type:complete